ncbi:MAG: MFS transporter [Chloroflexi bacterium]|nr:MFS transporter [Chloroflexota bacterium]MDA1227922.1 MFS transporter [Chloroflexota bacterium]
MRIHLTGLWRDPDFLRLWTARTVSELGTLMSALQLTSVLVLGATPFQMGILGALRMAPGAVAGFLVGPWVDAHRKRPIMIAADLGRAALFASIPAAFFMGLLRIEQIYAVAFLDSVLSVLFDVAYRSYLPSLVHRGNLLEANSKLTGSESFVEVTAFSVGGWIAQIFSAITVAVVDIMTFLASAVSLYQIKVPEPEPVPPDAHSDLIRQLLSGLALVWRDPLLRPITLATASQGLTFGIFSAIMLIFGIRELGIQPGLLGTIYALGGVSSLFGSVYVGSLSRRFGIGPVMVVGFLVFAISVFLVPAARGPLIGVILFLAGQQMGDGFMTMYLINQTSVRQAVTAPWALGRVNSIVRSVEMTGLFVGFLLGGALAEEIGMRTTLVVGGVTGLAGAVVLALSPVIRMKFLPSSDNPHGHDVLSP